jgi:hypothetical protein
VKNVIARQLQRLIPSQLQYFADVRSGHSGPQYASRGHEYRPIG